MIEQHDSTPHNYPLVRTIPLGEPTRQMRVLRRRDTSELPPALPHQVWVLNVNGQLQVHKPMQFTLSLIHISEPTRPY